MKFFLSVLAGILLLSVPASLSASEVILYGGAQKPGSLSWANANPLDVASDLAGDFGSTFGLRYSAGRVVGFEQSIAYSPRFARPGVRAFQMDSNLVVQAPGKIVPYGTFGIGIVRTWGQDIPTSFDPGQITAFVFSVGNNFAINYGGGLKMRRLWGPLGINIDVRGYTLPGVQVIYEDITVIDKSLRFIQTTAGLTINW